MDGQLKEYDDSASCSNCVKEGHRSVRPARRLWREREACGHA